MKMEILLDRTSTMSRGDLVKSLFVDKLTGVWNRRAFEEADHSSALAIVDLDSLKWINDRLGHEEGDEALRQLGELLNSRFPGVVFRLCGDEFAILCSSRELLLGGLLLAQRDARSAVVSSETVILNNAAAFSFGIGDTLERADFMMREDKRQREIGGERAHRGDAPPGFLPKLQLM